MSHTPMFYGVSAGPGDPELLTLKAHRILTACPVIAFPRTRSGRTLALDIVSQVVDMTGKTLLPLPVAMTRRPEELKAEHTAAADLIRPYLEQGQDVAMLTLGDVSIYSTVHYVLRLLEAEGWQTGLIAGVPSFCASASALGQSLTTMNEPLHIYPAGVSDLPDALGQPGVKVLMKSGKRLPEVVDTLKADPRVHQAALAMNCGLPDEILCPSLDDYRGEETYFATLLVK